MPTRDAPMAEMTALVTSSAKRERARILPPHESRSGEKPKRRNERGEGLSYLSACLIRPG